MSTHVSRAGMQMNRSGALLITLFAAVAMTACGSKQSPTATNEQPAAQPASPAEQQPAAEGTPAAGDAAVQGTATEQPAAATPSETVSETDDGAETPEVPAASAVQPSLQLGGPATTSPTSAQFKEGTNYTKLVPAQPTSVAPGKVEVVEVFWYGCGHCFALEPEIESWRGKGKPANVEFVRVPAMWNEATRMHARVYFTAELLGKLEQLHAPIFREVNVKGNTLNTVEKITAFFAENGVSSDDFQKAFSSFAVESKLQRADFLNRRYRIESVPTVIVNGKFKTDVAMAGGEKPLFGLINELAAHESGG